MGEDKLGSPPGSLARLEAFIHRGWIASLKPTEKDVWIVYNSYADNFSGEAYPSQQTIANILKTDIRNVQRARKSLVYVGLLSILETRGGYNKNGSLVKVLMPNTEPPVNSTTGEINPRLNLPPVNSTTGEINPVPPVNSTAIPPVKFTPQTPQLTPHEPLMRGNPEIPASPDGAKFECKGGKSWSAGTAFENSLALQFPSLDIAAQVRLAAGWCESNANRRKTLGGMPRFLNGWMKRAATSPTSTTPKIIRGTAGTSTKHAS